MPILSYRIEVAPGQAQDVYFQFGALERTPRQKAVPGGHSGVLAGRVGDGPIPIPSADAPEFNKALEGVVPAAEMLLARLAKLATKPKEVGLEFGIKMGGRAGLPFVTEGSAEAHFVVKVTWQATS